MHLQALVLSLLLVITQLPSPSAQLTSCGHCVCDRPSVTCDFDKSQSRIKGSIDLTGFAPSGASLRSLGLDPLGYREFYINCKSSPSLRNQRLTRDLLREFANLTRVAIVKCDLAAIDPDALTGLNQLMDLDVSNNRLQQLPPGLFLPRSLRSLTLSDNPGLSLDPGTFQNAYLERLVLSNCHLAEFPWPSLQAIKGLRELTLSQNRIRLVPAAAMEFAAGLRVFYLDDNPLACTCANRLLREKIDWNRVSPSIIKSSKQPKCGSPRALQDVELTRLSPADFPCRPPEIHSVDIQLHEDSAQLICSALVDQPQPGPMIWTYRHQPIFPDMPHGYPSRTYRDSGTTFRQVVSRTPGYKREKYTVTASNEDGQTANFSLTVHWPEGSGSGRQQTPPTKQPAKSDADLAKKSSGTTIDGAQGEPESKDPQQAAGGGASGGADYFSRKQFTLVEMIIAVVGTFMGTSLVFLLSCQFIRWYNKRDKKRWAAGYTTQPYSYNYNSHRPPSHEYDVPRIDLPCLPKQPPPPTGPPPVPLPMPQSQPTPGTAPTQTLHSSAHHHHLQQQQQQQQQLLPKPPLTPPSPRSCSELAGGDLEFLDYNGQRWMLGTSRLN